jgi:hypothetical protein
MKNLDFSRSVSLYTRFIFQIYEKKKIIVIFDLLLGKNVFPFDRVLTNNFLFGNNIIS